MQVYIRDDAPEAEASERVAHEEGNEDAARKSPFGVFRIGPDGATLMPYETLINPPVVESNALHWPWERVCAELKKLESLGRSYVGRRLYLLYNPMTGRTNGTTPNFFATITIRPPGIVDRPHRHVSAAINYYFHGSGRSSVAGNVYHWKAGDLMLSAPGWTVHNHASDDEFVHELTVQDQPLNIAMESLLWQEDMHKPPALLGAQAGFTTNRPD
jgi:gentisate 1,2-dioxygenase